VLTCHATTSHWTRWDDLVLEDEGKRHQQRHHGHWHEHSAQGARAAGGAIRLGATSVLDRGFYLHCGHTNVRSRYRESSTSLRWIFVCYHGFHLSRIDPRAGGLRKIFVHAAAHLLLVGHRTIPVRRTRLTREPTKRCANGAKGPAGLAKVRVVRATELRAHLFGSPFAG